MRIKKTLHRCSHVPTFREPNDDYWGEGLPTYILRLQKERSWAPVILFLNKKEVYFSEKENVGDRVKGHRTPLVAISNR